MRLHTVLLAGLLAAAGCVGGINDGGGDDGGNWGNPANSVARGMFESDVYPILSVKCSAGCHQVGTATSTPFVAQTVGEAWNTITGYTSVVGNYTQAGAPVWFRIVPGPHNNRTFTPEEQTAVSGWLAQEVIDRQNPVDPGGPPPNETPGAASGRLISEWSGCLNLADFTELRFGEVWANKNSGQGNCEVCHVDGYRGMIANDSNDLMYEVLSTNKNFMATFFKVNVLDMSNPRIETNIDHIRQVGLRQPPHIEHPSFDPNDTTGQTGTAPAAVLEEIYNRTMGYKAAGTCGPPRIPQ